MKKFGNVLWGLIFIMIGVIIAINALEIAEINIFFKGWWTLFIIVPCTIKLFSEGNKTGNIIGILIGVSLLLASQGILNIDIVWKLMFPAILIIIGVSLIFRDYEFNNEIKKIKVSKNTDNEYWATFAAQNIDFSDEEFNGSDLNAIFGAVKCDLRKAIIKQDLVINATAIFGGVEILVPENVKVKVKSLPLFGGTSNKANNDKSKNSHTIYVNSIAIFGGVEIK